MTIFSIGEAAGYVSQATINDAIFKVAAPRNSGTGGYNTFLAIQDNDGTEEGFNTDGGPSPTNQIGDSKTSAIRLSSIPVTIIDGVEYYEIRLDLNETNGGKSPYVDLNELKIYTGSNVITPATPTTPADIVDTQTELDNLALRYDLDAGGDNTIHMFDGNSGSGTDDYSIFIPVSAFTSGPNPANLATDYIYLYAQIGTAPGDFMSDGGFEEFNLQNAFALTGTKFNDIDGDGVRDTGEGGVSGVTIFIDADKDGVLDTGERSTVTDSNGNYTFGGLVAGTYQIDEVIPPNSVQTTGAFETITVSSFTPGQVFTVDAIGNRQLVPSVDLIKTAVAGQTADVANETLNYTITVDNNGDIDLTNVVVTDNNADPGSVQYVSGDANNNQILETTETWTYTAQHTLTQAEIDSNGDGDGDIDNIATVNTAQGVTDNDDATIPVARNPQIAIDKVFVNVTGGDGDTLADAVNDVLNYTVRVTNTGNVTLTGVTVTDPLTGMNFANVTLAPGAHQDFATSYTLTQADLDKAGNAGSDGDIDNTATADSNETGSVNDSAEVPLVYNPQIAIDKVFVNVTGGDGDTLADAVNDVLNYTVRVTNTGNVTLTGVTVTDPLTGMNFANVTLAPGAHQDFATSYTLTQADLDKAGNAGSDGDIDNTATADSNETGSVNDSAEVPLVYNPQIAIDKVFVNVTGGDGDTLADAVNDVLNYTVRVTNTGNVTLTGVTVTDPLTGMNFANVTLAPGAHQDFATSYTLTQADLDKAGNAGSDGDIDNTATADSNETGSVNDSAEVPLVYNPQIAIDKVFVNVTGGDGDTLADAVNDVLNYTVRVTNTGNVTLTGVTVTDPLTGMNFANVTLAPGAHQDFATSYTLTQADLDKAGNAGSDGDIDNTATADSNETGSVNDSAEVPLVYNPSVNLEKFVSIDGSSYIDADTAAAGYQNVAVQSAVYFRVTVANNGNVTLENPLITDINTTGGLPGTTLTLYQNGALTAAAIAAGAVLTGDDNDGNAGNGVTPDGILQVGETWTIEYTQGFDFGQHVNTAYVTTTQGAIDNDAAYYYGIVEGPGVRTPGFWQGANNGAPFWNGNPTGVNDSKTGAGFTQNGDLLIYGNTNGTTVDDLSTPFKEGDANNDGVVNASDQGLLIGDYNLNGVRDGTEDTLFISLNDAKQLIDASQKAISSDGVVMVGRDVVATWLNYLAGNGIGNANDVESPKHFIDDAVDWLQTFGDASPSNIYVEESFDKYWANHNLVKTNSAAWNAPQGTIDHSASTMHSALDNYNNTGDTFAGGDPYAMNSHSAFDMSLIAASQPVI